MIEFLQANIGQDENFSAAEAKAIKLGAKKVSEIKKRAKKSILDEFLLDNS